MRGRFSRAALSVLPLTVALSACSTVYKPPTWNHGPTYGDSTNVKAYIDQHLRTYASLMGEFGGGKDFAAVLTILAALGGTTALALGAGTDVGIIAGSVGAGISQTTNYAKPHERLQLLGQAVGATTCIRDEFSKQAALRRSLGIAEDVKAEGFVGASTASALHTVAATGYLARQVDDAGEIAVDATRAISTSLQVKLINVSQVPDYAATVKSIQDAQKLADASKPAGLTGAVAQLVDEVSEYEKRIETCKAKLPS